MRIINPAPTINQQSLNSKPHDPVLHQTINQQSVNTRPNSPVPQQAKQLSDPKPQIYTPVNGLKKLFVNDLKEDEKKALLDRVMCQTSALLESKYISPNAIAKIFNIEHPRVVAAWKVSDSLALFYSSLNEEHRLDKIKQHLAGLSKESKDKLLAELGG